MARGARHTLLGTLALLAACAGAVAAPVTGPAPQEATQLLIKADDIKSADHTEFTRILARLQPKAAQLPAYQQQYLRYLSAWQDVYDGRYQQGAQELRALIDDSTDPTLDFRATSTLVNALAYLNQHQEAFSRLSGLLERLPQIADHNAREQALGVAMLLYSQAGEYDLSLLYAEKMIVENWAGRGQCKGGQGRLEALVRGGKVQAVTPEFQSTVDACLRLGELVRANAIRAYMARLQLAQHRPDEALAFLQQHYPQAQRIGHSRLMAEFDSLLAQGYRQRGDNAQARQFALRTVEESAKNNYMEPLVAAYRLLYELAKDRGDDAAALGYHEKYAATDKGYVDDVSARQLAYERARHEAAANRLQIDALNQQNQVLQLQQQLNTKAAETSRLYIALLITVLAFIGLWAYRTKRSQLHFMKLSRVDGLTGIANRPHFIELAERALDASRKLRQEVCVVLCDLDHFKSINDKYGHATGDFVLKQAVQACRAHLRATDLFGRFGGEEFCILLPGCSLADARQRCEQLRAAIATIATDPGSMAANVSASFGIAATGSSGYELRQLLAHADAALYRAKYAGRNCVMLYDTMSFVGGAPPEGEQRVRSGGARA